MAIGMRHQTTLRYIDEVAKVGSIRKAAETLAITPSALNRRILMFEEELGAPVFERLARGVRLNTAGEILILHIRQQMADMDRVKSQIADLSGVRRGHVSIACSQPLLRYFMPREIERYRMDHPAVTFDVLVRNGLAAEHALYDHTVDLALLFEPPQFAEFQTSLTIQQPVYGVMAASHPLAKHDVLRIGQCLEFPLALPPAPNALRLLLEGMASRSGGRVDPVVQSDSYEFLLNYGREEEIVTFYFPVGIPTGTALENRVSRPVDPQDIPPVHLYLGQLRNRILPVAAARFADQLTSAFVAEYDCE